MYIRYTKQYFMSKWRQIYNIVHNGFLKDKIPNVSSTPFAVTSAPRILCDHNDVHKNNTTPTALTWRSSLLSPSVCRTSSLPLEFLTCLFSSPFSWTTEWPSPPRRWSGGSASGHAVPVAAACWASEGVRRLWWLFFCDCGNRWLYIESQRVPSSICMAVHQWDNQ